MKNRDAADDATLIVVAAAVVLGLLAAASLWIAGNDWASSQLVIRPTEREPMPWFYERPTSLALGVATALNVLILGRLWVFILRVEYAARWYVAQRAVEAEQMERIAAEQDRARYGRTLR